MKNNDYSYNNVYKKQPFYVKYISVIFIILGFLLLVLTINSKGNNALPSDYTNYEYDWVDAGIVLDEQTQEYLDPIVVNYSPTYDDNLVDQGMFDRFINIANDIAEFGELDLWHLQFFEGNSKAINVVNNLLSILAVPFTFLYNIFDLVISVVRHLLGYEDVVEIVYSGGFFGGR